MLLSVGTWSWKEGPVHFTLVLFAPSPADSRLDSIAEVSGKEGGEGGVAVVEVIIAKRTASRGNRCVRRSQGAISGVGDKQS